MTRILSVWFASEVNPMTDAAPTIGIGVSSLHIEDFTGGRLPLDISASDESS